MRRRLSRSKFEKVMLPHLPAAYNLARWLLKDRGDVDDAVQDAYLRAFRAYYQFRGENSAAWLLKIVRNTCMTHLSKMGGDPKIVPLDTLVKRSDNVDLVPLFQEGAKTADEILLAKSERDALHSALSLLPADHREVIVLRGFEDMSYREIAEITGVPVGTVMSRLSRARARLRVLLSPQKAGGQKSEL